MSHELPKRLLASNPFATHNVRPGSLPYVFPPNYKMSHVVDQLRANSWRGQIVGPHGSGKTTLLRSLDEVWHQEGRTLVSITLRDKQRRLPKIEWLKCEPKTQLVVDGYEQLGWFGRWWLRTRSRGRRCGLLVTTHTTCTGLPVVYNSPHNLIVLKQLVRQLSEQPLADELIEKSYERVNGNMREAFMLLYDEYETCHESKNHPPTQTVWRRPSNTGDASPKQRPESE